MEMKWGKPVLVSASLFFATAVLLLSVVRTRAQTAAPGCASQITPSPTVAAEVKKIDYFLVYPGILPDHFLYPIKMIRDRIWLWLTTESLSRAEVLLLFADKRLGAGRALIEGNKVELGVTTITKAEKYLERAVNEAFVAEGGEEKRFFMEKLGKASLKHQEILLELKDRLGAENGQRLNSTIELNNRLVRRIFEGSLSE